MSDIAAVNQVIIEGVDQSGPAFDSAIGNIKRTETAANSMGAEFKVAADALKSLGDGSPLGALESSLGAIGGTAGAASLAILGVAAAVLALAKSTADSINELRVLSAQAGTTGENFLTLKTMAAEAGVEGDNVAIDLEGEDETALVPFAWITEAKLVLNDNLMKRGAEKRAERLAQQDRAQRDNDHQEEDEA